MSYFYYIICLGILLLSCRGNSSKKEQTVTPVSPTAPTQKSEVKFVNSIKITSPEKNKEYFFGEEVTIAFQNKERFPIDSTLITIDGKKVAKLGKDVDRYQFQLPADRAGLHTLKVTCWHPENKRGNSSINIYLKPHEAPKKYRYEVIKVFPHDTKAYTQGLQYHDGYMYEGTGQYGESSLRKIDMQNGKALSVLNLDTQYFGEGITIYKDKIYQITWQSKKGFVYDLQNFTLESTFSYNSEGWGITATADHLIMSDGSNKLYLINPSNFYILKEIEVYDHQGKVDQLNELEYVNGLIWANIWMSDRIIAIDPQTGVVKAELNLEQLLSPTERGRLNDQDDVLNGIAWNKDKNTFYLTGKRWPKLFEIKIKE